MSLRAFLTRLIGLCVLPLLLLAVGLAIERVRTAEAEGRDHGEDLAGNAAIAIDEHLTARLGALRFLAASPLLDEPARHGELYHQALGLRGSIGGEVVLADAGGRMLFHTARPFGEALPPLPQSPDSSAVRRALDTGQPAIGDVAQGPLIATPTVAIAAPYPAEGRPRLLLIAIDRVDRFVQLLRDQDPPEGWTLTVLDSRGTPIARHGHGAREADAAAASAAAADGDAAGRRFAARTRSAPWTVVAEVSREQHALPLVRVSLALAVALLGATLASVLGGAWAARRLASAMGSLADEVSGVPPLPAPRDLPAGVPIAEIDAVRRRLAEAVAERERAEGRRREAELEHRQSIEQASIALQVSEGQLRGIVESASEAIITADRGQTIVMANAAAARMFRCRVDELVGAPLERLMPEAYRAKHRHLVEAFGEEEGPARPMVGRPDVTGLRADGERFPAEAAIATVHIDGQRLYTVVVRDVTERRRAERALRESQAALEQSHADLRRLVAAQDGVAERERLRISRELHDDLQQTLAALLMEASSWRGNGLPGDVPRMAQALGRIEALAANAIASTRRIIQDLRPQMIELLGLVPSLEQLADQFMQRTGIACDVDTGALDPADEPALAPLATCLYRVAQESLNNAAKHAQATRVAIALASDGQHGLTLTVSDNGRGIGAGDRRKPGAFGLLGMAERVHAAGGVIAVGDAPGGGTAVTARFRLPEAALSSSRKAGSDAH